jgi:hypothetical protein
MSFYQVAVSVMATADALDSSVTVAQASVSIGSHMERASMYGMSASTKSRGADGGTSAKAS